jgi:hypothetical protein
MTRLEDRIDFSSWNEEHNLVIPKDKVEEYKTWYSANVDSFKQIGVLLENSIILKQHIFTVQPSVLKTSRNKPF